MLPNFLVIGAARCGTTSLHYYLAEHPDICMSSIKEPNYFLFQPTANGPRACIEEPSIIAKSVTDRVRYERLFEQPGAPAVGEASPLYVYVRETPELIRDSRPEMRLITVVREPISRAWSHFVYVNGDSVNRGSVNRDGGETTAAAFATACERELPLGYEPYRTGTHFLRLSSYAEQLERYRRVFPHDQLLVLSYDDLVAAPGEALARVCRFLGVDDAFAFDTSVQYNPSSGDRSLLGRVDQFVRPAFPRIKRLLPARVSGRLAARRARWRAAHRGEDRLPLSDELRARLEEHFRPDVEWLAREEGIHFE